MSDEYDEDDFCAPFGDLFGDKIFIKEVVFTKDAVEITEPHITQSIIDTCCDQIRVKSNNGGRIFDNNIHKNLKYKRHKCIVQTRQTIANK